MATVNEFWPSIFFHPGESLAEKLGELKKEAEDFAYRTGLDVRAILSVLRCESPVSPEMAIRFEEVLGIPSYMWLGKQTSYDKYMARKRDTVKERGVLSREPEMALA